MSKFGVFKFSDYDLNLDERRMKFKKYDHVICEDCNQEVEKFSFLSNTSHVCSTYKIFETSDYDLNLRERRAKYMGYNYISCKECNLLINKMVTYWKLIRIRAKYKGYYAILCEECNQEIDKYYFYCTGFYKEETDINKKTLGSTFEIFNTSDYNLNLKERRAKYMFNAYEYTILCEKCNNEFNGRDHYCIYCYRGESNINKKRYMKYGSNFKFFNTSDYNDLNLEKRRVKYMFGAYKIPGISKAQAHQTLGSELTAIFKILPPKAENITKREN
ncbi:hypothetical protein RhiirC2_768680 [Rhizophagus irregularis]|uniref:Uncharacterized protein n=1 Tax=Rhizophagus irregularis TaxID=588596 RepID=A0A2N1P146_9GLOM|nr:hypothetical protein RhiirC2_768680 [Rhizophagus irregularis]